MRSNFKIHILTAALAVLTMSAALPANTAQAAAIPPIEGHTGTLNNLTNDIGRAYQIDSIYFMPINAATNAVTLTIVNTQNTDTVATNTSNTAVAYLVDTILVGATGTRYAPTIPVQVPAGCIVRFSANLSSTNSYLINRSEGN